MTVAGAVAVLPFASIACLKWLPLPFAWISLGWAAAAFWIMRWLGPSMRPVASTVGAMAVALGLAELWFGLTLPADVVRTLDPGLNAPHPVLGWAPRPSQRTHATATVHGGTLYDVTYTIDAEGHRISATGPRSDATGCVLFFADSFAFGEGVEDAQSLPFRFDALMQGRLRVVNFAAPAYGAEHMLARLERGDLASAAPCQPTHVVYLALPHHIVRAAGKTPYSAAGPRYRLGSDGAATYVSTSGPQSAASAARSRWVVEWEYQSAKSQIRRALSARRADTTDADAALYYAIVQRAFALCADRWPLAQRHIVAWDINPSFAGGVERFHAGLAAADAKLHPIDQIIAGYSENPLPHSIHAREMHPNAATHDTVARYLAAQLQ